jgi:hypothetical protein
VPIVLKSGSLNLLEHSGPVQDCFTLLLRQEYKSEVLLPSPADWLYMQFSKYWHVRSPVVNT